MFKNILLPTDGSQFSEEAIKQCIELARLINAKITGFHAEPKHSLLVYGAYAEMGDVDTAPPSKGELERSEEVAAKKFLAVIETAAKQAGVACECFYRPDNHPFDAIIKAAEEKGCDLIFMASHGTRGREGLVIGSETNKVLTHTEIPVLVYR